MCQSMKWTRFGPARSISGPLSRAGATPVAQLLVSLRSLPGQEHQHPGCNDRRHRKEVGRLEGDGLPIEQPG